MGDPDTTRETIPLGAIETKLPVSGDVPSAGLPSPPGRPAKSGHRRFDLWLHRVSVLMFVFICATVGVLLVILPWRPEWTDNHLFLLFPSLRALAANGFFRGVCSGLGLLDIWIGFWEAVHYHEGTPSQT